MTPAWWEPLPDAEMMRATDRWAIGHCGIPSLELMERAGRGLAEVAERVLPDGPIAVVCGRGNNGGDGLVVARLLREAGHEVRCLLLSDDLERDPAANLARLGAAWEPFSPAALAGAVGIVDAVLGTGFSGVTREGARAAIEAMNAADAPVVAADVPSGVDASTGEVSGPAVRAVATATFAAAKPGLRIEPGRGHAGELIVVDIGIPAGAPGTPDVGLVGDAVLGEIPRRARTGTKFDSGHVLVCGGSPGLTGAPILAAQAALRAGAGYVTACVPEDLRPVFEVRLLEVMTASLDVEDVVARSERGGALVVGPGMGRLPDAQELARELTRRVAVPIVLDADGLNAHAGRLGELAERAAPTILTPHEGELGRLLEVGGAEVKARRLHHVREAARRSGAIVVLKGDDTLVAEPPSVGGETRPADGFRGPAGRVGVSPGATPALATAGTGDVLAGVLGALLAKGMDPFTAACAAVRLHARAGVLAAERVGGEGVIASDVIAALPAVR